MFDKNQFGARLKEVRKNAGEKQEELADFLGVWKSSISEMESGKKMTTAEKIALICERYNISADYLLGLTDERRPLREK